MQGNIPYVLFCVWLLSVNIKSVGWFVYVACYNSSFFFFLQIPHRIQVMGRSRETQGWRERPGCEYWFGHHCTQGVTLGHLLHRFIPYLKDVKVWLMGLLAPWRNFKGSKLETSRESTFYTSKLSHPCMNKHLWDRPPDSSGDFWMPCLWLGRAMLGANSDMVQVLTSGEGSCFKVSKWGNVEMKHLLWDNSGEKVAALSSLVSYISQTASLGFADTLRACVRVPVCVSLCLPAVSPPRAITAF